MKDKCVFCKESLVAEISNTTSYFDDFNDEWCSNTTKRLALLTDSYSNKEHISGTWCPKCGLNYKYFNKGDQHEHTLKYHTADEVIANQKKS